MLRKIAVSLAALGALSVTDANALGLGEVTLQSALNQPLRAEIELLQLRGLTQTQIIAGMAGRDEYHLAGIDYTQFHNDIRFDLIFENGRAKLRVSSRDAVKEPFLNFLVEINWPSGRLVREYTLLLDPPVFDNAPQAPLPLSAPRVTVEPVVVQAAPLPPAVVPVAQPTQAQRPAPAASNIRTRAQEGHQVFVDVHDTLWEISQKYRPDSAITVQQMMLALQRLNPEAFAGNNINRLKSGVVLTIPSLEQARQLSFDEAVREVERQTRLWKQGGRDSSAQSRPQALDATPSGSTQAGSPSPQSGGQLRIVSTPAAEGKAPGKPEASAGSQQAQLQPSAVEQALLEKNRSLEEQVVVTLEGLDKVERDNEELFDRLDALSERMEAMQRLITLKDQQMAELQAQLAAAQAQVDASGPDNGAAGQSPAPTPVAPAPVAPEAEANARSLLDRILSTPAYLAGLGGGAIALLGGLLFWLRRRGASSTEADDEAVEAALADLERREAERAEAAPTAGAASAAGVAAAAGAVAAAAGVAASQETEEARAETEARDFDADASPAVSDALADDPFQQLSDAEELLSSSDTDDLDDLVMELGLDELSEQGGLDDDFASSLLSDAEFDLGDATELEALERQGEQAKAASAGQREERALAGGSSDEADFDAGLEIDLNELEAISGDELPVEAVADTAPEESDEAISELDFILGSDEEEAVAGDLAEPEVNGASDAELDELEFTLREVPDQEEILDTSALDEELGALMADDEELAEAPAVKGMEPLAEVGSDEGGEEFDNELEALFADADEGEDDEVAPSFLNARLDDSADETLASGAAEEASPTELDDDQGLEFAFDLDGDEPDTAESGITHEEAPEPESQDGDLLDEGLDFGLELDMPADESAADEGAPGAEKAAPADEGLELDFHLEDEAVPDAEPGDGLLALDDLDALADGSTEEAASLELDIESGKSAAETDEELFGGLSLEDEGESAGAEEANAASALFDELSAGLTLDEGLGTEPATESASASELEALLDAQLQSEPEMDSSAASDDELLAAFDQAGEEELEAELNAMLEEEGNQLSLDESGSLEEAFGDDFLAETDEVGTKLDLARAYIDMDDAAGARDILQEVIDEGSEQQVAEARQLLQELDV